MQRCFELAKNGAGNVAPNPLVGAIVVKDRSIIGEGFHHYFGGPHAEVEALSNFKDDSFLNESTLYVNLEPCSHHGKTPPCTEFIIGKGIKRVVIANQDPNPLVSGDGIRQLKKAGIEVVKGILEKEGNDLNKRFFTFHKKKRPFIILKWAQTADGFIAPKYNKSKPAGITWISNETSRLMVHKWRSEEMAVLTGSNTIKNDDPLLTTRHFSKKNPTRIIVDRSMKLNALHKVFNNDAPTLVFNENKNEIVGNIERIKIDKSVDFIKGMLNHLFQREIQSVIIEGGTTILNEFIKNNLWDEARVFTGNKKFSEGIKAPEFNFHESETISIDGDILRVFNNHQSESLW